MPIQLEYAQPTPPVKTRALTAMIYGLCSGPAAYGLAALAVDNTLPEGSKERLGLTALAMPLVGALVFGCIVKNKLPTVASRRDRKFANVGVAAPIAWSVAIFVLIIYALSQV